jgi:hypothetical protein
MTAATAPPLRDEQRAATRADRAILARYTDQPTALPRALRGSIERRFHGRPVQLYALADLGWRLRSIDETGADLALAYRFGTPIAAIALAVLLAACWLVMVRTGRLALLWAALWGLPCAAVTIALLVTLNFAALTILTPAIALAAPQLWVAHQARMLRIESPPGTGT